MIYVFAIRVLVLICKYAIYTLENHICEHTVWYQNNGISYITLIFADSRKGNLPQFVQNLIQWLPLVRKCQTNYNR